MCDAPRRRRASRVPRRAERAAVRGEKRMFVAVSSVNALATGVRGLADLKFGRVLGEGCRYAPDAVSRPAGAGTVRKCAKCGGVHRDSAWLSDLCVAFRPRGAFGGRRGGYRRVAGTLGYPAVPVARAPWQNYGSKSRSERGREHGRGDSRVERGPRVLTVRATVLPHLPTPRAAPARAILVAILRQRVRHRVRVIMSEAEAVAPVAASPKKPAAKSSASKKPRAKPAHPKTAEMVQLAIKNLKERGGSSLQAIKKYIAANYKVDAEKLAPFIKKYIKTAVTSGSLVQTKGKGASGSFKLASKEKAEKSEKKPKKAASPKKAKPAGEKKPKAAKKPAGEKKPKAAKKPAAKKPAAAAKKPAAAAAPKKAKSPSKAKKATKAPAAKKPKAPKPKKAAAKPKAAPKKK